MIAVLINCVAVIAGSLIGLLVGKKLSEDFRTVVYSASALVIIVMGVQMAMESSNFLVLLISLLAGGGVGYLSGIEDAVLRLGEKLEKVTSKGKKAGGSDFAKGFMNASVLFCSGAMSVVGSIQAGTTGNIQTILIKSVMDGCMAVILATVYGTGVLFSFLPVFVYQGFFTLAGRWIEPLIGTAGISELSAAGGIMLMMIGLGLLKIKEFKTANFLPAIIFAPLFIFLAGRIV